MTTVQIRRKNTFSFLSSQPSNTTVYTYAHHSDLDRPIAPFLAYKVGEAVSQ